MGNTPLSVLIVEDDPDCLANLAQILELEGFQVAQAVDGLSAWNWLQSQCPDIVICDIMMPQLDGHALLEKVRSHPRHRHLPFIFLTALADGADFRRGMNRGADDYLVKPFLPLDVIQAVHARLCRLKENEFEPDTPEDIFAAVWPTLTPREIDVLRGVGQGLTSKEIAGVMGISPRTVETHRASLLRKFGTRNSACLIQASMRLKNRIDFPSK